MIAIGIDGTVQLTGDRSCTRIVTFDMTLFRRQDEIQRWIIDNSYLHRTTGEQFMFRAELTGIESTKREGYLPYSLLIGLYVRWFACDRFQKLSLFEIEPIDFISSTKANNPLVSLDHFYRMSSLRCSNTVEITRWISIIHISSLSWCSYGVIVAHLWMKFNVTIRMHEDNLNINDDVLLGSLSVLTFE